MEQDKIQKEKSKKFLRNYIGLISLFCVIAGIFVIQINSFFKMGLNTNSLLFLKWGLILAGIFDYTVILPFLCRIIDRTKIDK